MRPWREILKDDDTIAAILAMGITMAIALLIVGCVGVGCYGVYNLCTVIFSCEDQQRVIRHYDVSDALVSTWYEINDSATIKISDVTTFKFKSDTIRHDSA